MNKYLPERISRDFYQFNANEGLTRNGSTTNHGDAELLENAKMISQLCVSERKTARFAIVRCTALYPVKCF
jgi:hypothetical protein